MDPVSLQRHVELDISADALWDLVADPDQLAAWLGDTVDLDIVDGGTGTIVDDGVSRFVHVDRVEAGRSLGFTWWESPADASQVQLEIIELDDGGSRLTITETFQPTASASVAVQAGEPLTAAARWEVRVCALWACTVVAALVQ